MSPRWIGRKLALFLTEDWDVQFRRIYGYVGEIKLLPLMKNDGAKLRIYYES